MEAIKEQSPLVIHQTFTVISYKMLQNIVSILVFLLVLAEVAVARRVIRAAPESNKTGCYIVQLDDDTSHDRFEELTKFITEESMDHHIYEKVEGNVSKIITAKLSEDALHRIKLLDNVELLEQETYATAAQGSIPWYLDRIDQRTEAIDGQYNNHYTGEGIDIYILDSGIRYDHSEFEGKALYPGYDPVDYYTGSKKQGADCTGHGTHVASLAVGKTYGVAKNARVYSVRVLDCTNFAPWSYIIDGINYAAEQASQSGRPSIISMSIGGGYTTTVDKAVKNVVNNYGIPVVVAAGNGKTNACNMSPASTTEAITVGGTTYKDKIYYYSNTGSCVDIFAPGSDIVAASYSCSTCTMINSGTSMATPIVSGVIASLLQQMPTLTPTEIKQQLINSSTVGAIKFQYVNKYLKRVTPNRLVHVIEFPADPAITWPDGTFSLPMSASGCPSAVTWQAGSIHQDNEDMNNNNVCGDMASVLSGKCDKDLTIDYCSKTETVGDRGVQWPNGSYCVGKKGDCPTGFNSGSVYWDDENYRNLNYISGTVPDGEYGTNTRIEYCCRNDSSPSNAIVLPVTSPFLLLCNHQSGCQAVKGMEVKHVALETDDENDCGDKNQVSGSYPCTAGGSNNLLSYCYYSPTTP